uniref:hypothetical protein n=1 Tax=Streptomyces sp. DG1A-41 TaxID=3125779 RepID=UPI004040201D
MKLALRIALRDAEDGTTIEFGGTATADGRIKDLPPDAVEGAATRLLNRFAEQLAAAVPETTTFLATQDFEPRATTDYETTPEADDAAPPPPAGATGGAMAGTDEEAGASRPADATSADAPTDTGTAAGAPETAGETPAPGPDDKTSASGQSADEARATAAGDEPSAPGRADEPSVPAAGDDASAAGPDDKTSASGQSADEARATAAGDEPSAPGRADEPPVPAAGDDASASGPGDEPPAPPPEPPSVFEAGIAPSSLGPSDGEDEDDEGGEDGDGIAEAAHARRTMIGRSAEEVDHAPPRGRYAPVPAPQTVMPPAPLRWAAPAAALALASAIVAVRALRRRR